MDMDRLESTTVPLLIEPNKVTRAPLGGVGVFTQKSVPPNVESRPV